LKKLYFSYIKILNKKEMGVSNSKKKKEKESQKQKEADP